MQYVKALQKAIDSEPAVTGRTREELEAGIKAITTELAGPLNNADRIMLAASRSAMRKSLEELLK